MDTKIMPIGSVELAMDFHELYEKLAPDFGYITHEETRNFDADSPNGQLMIRVARGIIEHYHFNEVATELAASREVIEKAEKLLRDYSTNNWSIAENSYFIHDANEILSAIQKLKGQ